MKDIQTLLDAREKQLLKVKKEKKRALKKVPEGSLRICKSGKRVQYYHRLDPKDFNGVYIKEKDINLARKLAQKDYDQKILKACEKELNAIERYHVAKPSLLMEEIHENLHEERQKLIVPIKETDEEYIKNWEAVEYSGKNFYSYHPEYYTVKGERVRSKSEVIIADVLNREGIPYRYEYPIYLNHMGEVFPDFTILNVRTRKEVLWEHLGMMDDPEYVEKAVKKIVEYEQNGIFPGENLILTYETRQNPVNQKLLNHRKTYVGAMPGRIMTAMIQAGSSNPLLLLDEIDKMGSDYRGDPSAALLEVLDAEQNHTYRDHYLEIPYNLSDVLFITTANTLDTVPRPLLDRMEIIELGSYTDEEKLMIAKNHLIPKQLQKHGLKKSQLRITDEAIREIITCYTRESGVRSLERAFGEICRKAAMQVVSQESPKRVVVTGSNIEKFLGVRKYLPDRLPCMDQVGLVTGLAWTSVGGETLEVEVNVMDGSGKLELTGNLGDVMKESAHAALSYIRANAQKLGIAPDFYKNKDIHVHFPEGAVPKDGPSAGITVCTAIVSALTGVTVRRDIAMTGEISLRGRVMRIGGLKEKTMAALRHGIRTVIIPAENERDLEEIDQTVRRQLNFISAHTVDTVLDAALNHNPEMVSQIMADLSGDRNKNAQSTGLRQ